MRRESRASLLEKRPSRGLWGGLWSFPECNPDEIDTTIARLGFEPLKREVLTGFRHTFTHFHLDITPVLVKSNHLNTTSESNQRVWYSLDQPMEIGLTRPVTKLINQLKPSLSKPGQQQ